MKKMMKKCASLCMSVVMTAAVAAVAVPAVSAAEGSSVELTFDGSINFYGNRAVLEQYVCKDANTVKLLSDRKLYAYDAASDTFDVEFTFPEQQEMNPTASAGSYRVYSGVHSAYVNENTGMLYYAYDKYQYINEAPGTMEVEIVAYDLEKGGTAFTLNCTDENLSAVGADDNGNIYLAVRRQIASLPNATALYVYDKNGSKIASADVENPIDTFCGFADSGKFYFAESAYTLLENGAYSISRCLKSGGFDGAALTLGAEPITYFDLRYNRPAALSGGYLTTYATRVYDTATDKAIAYFPGVSADGGDYYNHFRSPNTVINGNVAYVLPNSRKIMGWHIDDSTVAASYDADRDIVSITRLGDGLLALTKDGTQYSYLTIPFSAFDVVEERTVNLNELSVYQRTQADIVKHFADAAPQDYDAPFYETAGSAQAPYKTFTLSAESKENAVRVANFYRWLGGLSSLASADETVWSNAAHGAVLTEKNVRLTGALSHYPDKPVDMDEDFYQAGYAATSSGNLAFGYGYGQRALIDLLRGFLNDEGHLIPGHRDTFLTRNGVAFAAGYTEYAGVNTIPFTGDPNPQGTSAIGNDQPAYAWPAPGFFPEEEISTEAMWTVNLNTDLVGLSYKPFTVTVTDLTTGEQFVRDSMETGLYTTESWGKFISFRAPETDSYSGKSYKVEVFNLADGDGAPVTLEYTVNFFSYADKVEIDGQQYISDGYGNLTLVLPDYIKGDVNGDGSVTISDVTEMQRYIAELRDLDERAFLAADIDGDNEITVSDATLVQRYLAEFLKEL